MSHFISGTNYQGDLVLSVPVFKVIKPRMRHFLKTTAIEDIFTKKQSQKVMNNVCLRYSQQEKQASKDVNEKFINEKLEILKRKFKSSFNIKANGQTVENFFTQKEKTNQDSLNNKNYQKINLTKIAQRMPHNVFLEKKYRNNINIKLKSFEEAIEIDQEKQKIKSSMQYLSCESPNLQKTTYLLEKMKSNKNKKQTQKQNQMQWLKFKKQSSYKPKKKQTIHNSKTNHKMKTEYNTRSSFY